MHHEYIFVYLSLDKDEIQCNTCERSKNKAMITPKNRSVGPSHNLTEEPLYMGVRMYCDIHDDASRGEVVRGRDAVRL